MNKFKEHFDQINMNPKFKKLNNLISEFVTDYGLVTFDILDVSNHKHFYSTKEDNHHCSHV